MKRIRCRFINAGELFYRQILFSSLVSISGVILLAMPVYNDSNAVSFTDTAMMTDTIIMADKRRPALTENGLGIVWVVSRQPLKLSDG